MIKKFWCFALLIVLCFSFSSCAKTKKATESAFCLDTMINITCYGQNASEAAKAAMSEIRRIEFLLSPYIETSEIYQINHNAHKSPWKISDETAFVIGQALEFCSLTDGAFDITIKPLVDLWNIKAENPIPPTDEKINEAKQKVDYSLVTLKDGFISFAKEGMMIDLGGAAKGYACDKAVEILKSYGIKNAILDLGGNIYAMGQSEKKAPWRIGLQDPSGERGEYFDVVELSDLSCVTSGSYERYFEYDGKIYHHIINPHTGKCADTGLISVSVVADSSFQADMLSTAIFVMGEENFEKIKDNFSIKKYVVVDKTNNWRAY